LGSDPTPPGFATEKHCPLEHWPTGQRTPVHGAVTQRPASQTWPSPQDFPVQGSSTQDAVVPVTEQILPGPHGTARHGSATQKPSVPHRSPPRQREKAQLWTQ
jgi:hypothetical protein